MVFLFIAATGCPDFDLEVLATAGCPVVGREMLETGFPNDCAPAELTSSSKCDDITADVIIADSRSCTSSQLLIVMTSSLLLIASSRIYADVITAVSRFLSISNADVNVAARSFLQYMC
ncbi:grr1 family protein [Dorcoceras hygrometricum]|uniref:Grr1 family protein n=1 Tax=Dorcoceras hygrometricum TaxID=472368 RepID=A0A2Z7BHI8_9LAMI|nr:grr1 family protein [Dorcoceras hygrometricum]